MALVEGWRGEVCHVAVTDDAGRFRRYKITDPSFHNWPGLAMALRLDSLANMVDDLPLVIGSELPADRVEKKARGDETPMARLGREVWQDMRQLVRIQNMENPDAPLLSPPQAYFLRENLRLRFLSARIALLRHDEVTYKADLKAADAWLRRYFDAKAKPTQTALGVLKQLAGDTLSIEMPDISASLNAVRNYKLVRERSGVK